MTMADLDMVLAKMMALKMELDDIFRFSTFDIGQDLQGLEENRMDIERRFLLNVLRDVLKKLADVQGSLEYISRPVAEISVLHKNGSQYETGNGCSFRSGSLIEALIQDSGGTQRWVQTMVEYDGADYYLAGYDSVGMDGLTVRVRGVA